MLDALNPPWRHRTSSLLMQVLKITGAFLRIPEELEMKQLLYRLTRVLLTVGLVLVMIPPTIAVAEDSPRNIADDKVAERGGKVDLNNSSVRRFQQFPGMYPTLAGKIVLGGPYETIDDVLNLDLTERQRELFAKYRDNFTVTAPSIALNEGFDRINDGQYR